MESTIFIYHRKGKTLVFDKINGPEHDLLINDGWKHTTTLNCMLWIKNLLVATPKEDWIKEIESLIK
jgi:hypothetical protein